MLTTQEILNRVRMMSEADLRECSRRTCIPVATLAKIRYGVTQDPRASTIDTLRDYLVGRPALRPAHASS